MDGPNGSVCAHAYSDGVASVSTLPGLAGVAGSAGASVTDAAPASADAINNSGPGHLLPVADAAAVAVELGTSAVNHGAIDTTTGLEPVSCLCPESSAHPHPGHDAAWTEGGNRRWGASSGPTGARSTYYTATNVAQSRWAPA